MTATLSPPKSSSATTRSTREELRNLVGGRIFGVTFVKRSTGEERTMACRIVPSEGGAYNPDDHGLIWVFDMNKRDYRSIPLDAVTRLRIDGRELKFK